MILIIIGMVFMVVLIFSIFTIFSTRNLTTMTTLATCSPTSAQFSTSSLASQGCTPRGSSWKYFHNVKTNTILIKVQILLVWQRKNSATEIQVFYFFFGFWSTNVLLIKKKLILVFMDVDLLLRDNAHHQDLFKILTSENTNSCRRMTWWCMYDFK